MTLQLSPCTSADFPRLFTIISTVSNNEPYTAAVFPAHSTPAGRAIGAQRFLAMKNEDPNTVFLKIVDTKTDIMIGLAKWNVYKNTIPEEGELEGDYWDSEEEKEYARLLLREFLIPRREMIRRTGGNLICMFATIFKTSIRQFVS